MLSFLFRKVDPPFVTCHNYTNVFGINTVVFFEYLVRIINTIFFFRSINSHTSLLSTGTSSGRHVRKSKDWSRQINNKHYSMMVIHRQQSSWFHDLITFYLRQHKNSSNIKMYSVRKPTTLQIYDIYRSIANSTLV